MELWQPAAKPKASQHIDIGLHILQLHLQLLLHFV